jgi:FKBP-type peptidyl-prolyl cis-trans isomerase FklB
MKTPKFNVCIAVMYASLLTSAQAYANMPDPTTGLSLVSEQQKVSYTIGVKTAQELTQYDLDTAAYLAGYKDAAMGASFQLSEQDMDASITKFQQEIHDKRETEHKQMAKKMQDSAVKNLAAGTKFLDNNKTQPGVQVTASGLQYKIIKTGTGPKPKLGESVTVNYKGSTIDGKEFDSSFKRNRSATFKLEKGALIDGWVEALQMMPTGSTWQIIVPPALGYGEHGMPPVIEPNSVLIFQIELISVK